MPPPDYSAQRSLNRSAVVAAESGGLGHIDGLPLRLTMELSVDCNLRCPHCEFTPPRVLAHQMKVKPAMELGLIDLENVAEQIFPHIQVVVPSVVGEPMMFSEWERFLQLCEQYGVYADVCTNGTYLDRPTLERMGPVLTRLNVSMDGASPATFNKLRAPADFDEVVGRLEVLRDWRRGLTPEERPEVWVMSVLMLQWIDELPDMVRLLAELEIDGLGCGHLIALNKHWEASRPSQDPARSDKALREAARVARELGVSVSLPALFDGEDVSYTTDPVHPIIPKVDVPARPQDDRPYYCKYMWRELFVALNGDVSSCCGLNRPVIGNLREDFDLKKHFNDEAAVQMREGMMTGALHAACRACPQLAMFGGGTSYAEASFSDSYGALPGVKEQRRQEKG